MICQPLGELGGFQQDLVDGSASSHGGQSKIVEDVCGEDGHAIRFAQRVAAGLVGLQPEVIQAVHGQPGELRDELVGVGDLDWGRALISITAAVAVIAEPVSRQVGVQRSVP